MYQIPGYSFIHKNQIKRRSRNIYILNQYTYIERPDLTTNYEGEFECIMAEINPKHGKRNLIIGEIYRIPNTNEIESIERYETILNKLSSTKQEILIGTDQNIDLLKINDKQNTADFLDMFYSTGIIPTITRPTRVTTPVQH